jgi:hypothetical protein
MRPCSCHPRPYSNSKVRGDLYLSPHTVCCSCCSHLCSRAAAPPPGRAMLPGDLGYRPHSTCVHAFAAIQAAAAACHMLLFTILPHCLDGFIWAWPFSPLATRSDAQAARALRNYRPPVVSDLLALALRLSESAIAPSDSGQMWSQWRSRWDSAVGLPSGFPNPAPPDNSGWPAFPGGHPGDSEGPNSALQPTAITDSNNP